jgi:hypothetical protein
VGPRNKGPTWFVQLLNKVYLKEKSSRAACQETELFSFLGLLILAKRHPVQISVFFQIILPI